MTAHREPIPVTVISGFLGAGKTTLVNHLLRNADGRRLVVLVNDFGELPIDANLIESVEGDTLNLANGCACCSMGGDLYNAFINVLERDPPPDHLIIEASGVADPARIANFARAEPDLTLDAIVSIVDAENINELVKDPRIGPTILQQLKCAEIVIVNKLDLASQARQAAAIKKISKTAPEARIISCQYSNISVELLLGLHLSEKAINTPMEMPHTHGETYLKWSRVFDNLLDRKAFEQALSMIDRSVVRLKGIIQFRQNDQPHIVQWVFGRYSILPLQSTIKYSNEKSKLVAIGMRPDFNVAKLDQLFEDVQHNK